MVKTFLDPVCGYSIVVVFGTYDEMESYLHDNYKYEIGSARPALDNPYAGECFVQTSEDPNLNFVCIWIDSEYYKKNNGESDMFLADTMGHETLHAFLDICDLIEGQDGKIIIDNQAPEHWTYHFGKLFSYVYEVVQQGLESIKNGGDGKGEAVITDVSDGKADTPEDLVPEQPSEQSVQTDTETAPADAQETDDAPAFFTPNANQNNENGSTGNQEAKAEESALVEIGKRLKAFYESHKEGFKKMNEKNNMSNNGYMRLHDWLSAKKDEKYGFWDFYLPAIMKDRKMESFDGEKIDDGTEQVLESVLPYDKNSSAYKLWRKSLGKLTEDDPFVPFGVNDSGIGMDGTSGNVVKTEVNTDDEGDELANEESEMFVYPTPNAKTIPDEQMQKIKDNLDTTVIDNRLPAIYNPGIEVRGDSILIGGGFDSANYADDKNVIITLPLADLQTYRVGYIVLKGVLTEEDVGILKSSGWVTEPYNG